MEWRKDIAQEMLMYQTKCTSDEMQSILVCINVVFFDIYLHKQPFLSVLAFTREAIAAVIYRKAPRLAFWKNNFASEALKDYKKVRIITRPPSN